MGGEQTVRLLEQLHADWTLAGDNQSISRTFRFKNYYQTLAFVNALAWIAHGEDHHPDLEVGSVRKRLHLRREDRCPAARGGLIPSPPPCIPGS
jgi:4a-hydroxytetrahydrobiopterin dehydratase